MSAVPVTAHQVRSKVAWVLQKDPDALVIGLHAAGPWQGDGELDLGERRFAVVRADTVLEVREALADAEALRAADGGADRAGAGRAGPRRRRPPGPQQALPGRPLGGGQGPLQGAAARPVAPRPLPGRGAAGAPPARGRVSPGPGRRARRRHRLAGHLPPRLRHGGPRARPARAAPLGRGRRRGGPLSRRRRPNSATPPGAAWPRRWGRRPGRSSTSSRPGAARDAPRPGRRLRGRLRRGGATSPPSRPPPPGWSGSTATGRSRRTSAGSWPAPGATRSTTWTATSPSRRRATCCGPTRCSARSRPPPLRPPRPADAARLGGAAPPVRPGAGRRDRPRGRGRPGRRRGRGAPRRRPRDLPGQRAHADQFERHADGAAAGPLAPHPRGARGLVRPARPALPRRGRVGRPGARRPGRGRRPGRAVRRLRPPRACRRPPAGPRSTGRSASPWPTGPAAARTPARSSASRTSLARAVGRRPGRRRSPSCWSCSTG